MKLINPGKTILKMWSILSAKPGGSWLFNHIMKWIIPYTGTIKSKVCKLTPGHVKIILKDRRGVRNHLNSIHAIALTNLGEYTSGLALVTALPADVRGIPIKISVEFFKKARGRLIAESHVTPPAVNEDTDFEVYADILDQEGEVVARTRVQWRLGLVDVQS